MRRLPFRIYVAPRDGRGMYHSNSNKTLFVEGFKTEQARDDYWNKRIVPETTETAGAEYEYVMCNFPNGREWKFVSERRYSNAKLIRGNVEKFRGTSK